MNALSESIDLRNVKHLFWRVVGPNVWDRRCLASQAVNGLIGTLRALCTLNPVRGPRGQPTAVPNDRSRHQPFQNSPRASIHFFLMIRFSCMQLLESSQLPQPEKSHITESRYDISGAFSCKILISSHADTLMQSGAAPRDRTGHDVVLWPGQGRDRMAVGVGFEPTEPLSSPVFKTGAINRSTTPPKNKKPGLVQAGFESRANTFIQHRPGRQEQNENGDVALRMVLLYQGLMVRVNISTNHDTLINRGCRSRRHPAAACPAPRNSPAPRLARSSGRCRA